MKALVAIVLCAIFIVCLAETKSINTSIVLDDVERTIDLSRPNIVKHSITITAVNAGDKAANQIYFALTHKAAAALSFFEIDGTDIAHTKFENKLNRYCNLIKTKNNISQAQLTIILILFLIYTCLMLLNLLFLQKKKRRIFLRIKFTLTTWAKGQDYT